jgi:hypothetical protein
LRDYFSHGSFDERIKTINPILLNSILLKTIRILLIRDILEIPNIEMLLEMPYVSIILYKKQIEYN